MWKEGSLTLLTAEKSGEKLLLTFLKLFASHWNKASPEMFFFLFIFKSVWTYRLEQNFQTRVSYYGRSSHPCQLANKCTVFLDSGIFSPQSFGPVPFSSDSCNRRDLGSSCHLRQASREQYLAVRVCRSLCVTGNISWRHVCHTVMVTYFQLHHCNAILCWLHFFYFREFCCLFTAFWIKP